MVSLDPGTHAPLLVMATGQHHYHVEKAEVIGQIVLDVVKKKADSEMALPLLCGGNVVSRVAKHLIVP
jgi:hypothetical protein